MVVRKFVPWIAFAVATALGLTAANYLWPFAMLLAPAAIDLFKGPGEPMTPISTADLSGSGPGTLVTATTMPSLARTFQARGLRSARVVYRSTNGDTGQPTVVSGSVFTPSTPAPQGGWPVIAFGHGTLGINPECGPSLSPNLMMQISLVNVLTALGYAVALPDFEGLGVKGNHPFLDAHTAGLNMIDAVRALRHTFSDISDRWVALGHSQGGGASWAADEQAAKYAPELHLVGAVAASPPADITGLVEKAQTGTLTPEQRPAWQALVESLARRHPEVNRDDFRTGAAAHLWDRLFDCSTTGLMRAGAVAAQIGPSDLAPRTPEAAKQLRGFLRDWALPQQPLSAPLFVWYGGKDPYIDSEWTKAAVKRACEMGGTITIAFDPKGGHLPPEALMFADWIAQRFAGEQAPNDC